MVGHLSQVLDSLKQYTELPLEEIRTLDPLLYTSSELFALEIEHIWKKGASDRVDRPVRADPPDTPPPACANSSISRKVW